MTKSSPEPRRLALAVALACAPFLAASPAVASTVTAAGTITYNYSAGVLPDAGSFYVYLTSNPFGSSGGGQNYIQTAVVSGTGSKSGNTYTLAYQFHNIPAGDYYLSAFRDVNGNGLLESFEPWGSVSNVSSQLRVSGNTPYLNNVVNYGPFNFNVNQINVGKLSGNIRYPGAQTGTLAVKAQVASPNSCTGSCSPLTVNLTTAAWASGTDAAGGVNYEILVPAGTGYFISASLQLPTRSRTRHSDEGDFQLPGSTSVPKVDVASEQTVTVSTTLFNPPTLASAATNGAITGTVTYAGTKAGNVRIMAVATLDDSSAKDGLFGTVQAATGAFTLNVTSPAASASSTGFYFLIAGRDVNGDGFIDSEGGEPFGILESGGMPVSVGAGGSFAFAGSTAAVGTITIKDDPGQNTGQITGTVYVASGALTSGLITIEAERKGSYSDDGFGFSHTSTHTQFTIVPGQRAYPYTLKGLDSTTSYFVKAYVDYDNDLRFDTAQATFSAQSGIASLYWVGEPVGTYGRENCSGSCVLTAPVAVTTASATSIWGAALANTCGPSNNAACPASATNATSVDITLWAPTRTPPSAPGLSAFRIPGYKIRYTWSIPDSANGFRTVNSSGVADSQYDHSVTQVDALGTPNVPISYAIAAFNTSGASTSAYVSSYTIAAVPGSAVSYGTATSAGLQVQWSSGTTSGGYNPPSTNYGITLSTINVADSRNTSFLSGLAILAEKNIVAYNVNSPTAPIQGALDTGKIPTALAPWGSNYAANTTYYAYVYGINNESVATEYIQSGQGVSPAAAPVTVASTFTAVSSATMSVLWGNGGNAQDTTEYKVVLSTKSALPDAATYPTGSPAGDVVVSTTPAGASPQASASGLYPNTSYYFFVQARSATGLHSPFVGLGSTNTLAVEPSTTTPMTLATVTTATISVSWSSGTTSGPWNPLGTLYRLFVSTRPQFSAAALTDAGASGIASTAPATLPFYAGAAWSEFTPSPNTLYYAYVQAVSMNGVKTGWTQVGSGTSPPAVPAAATPAFTTASTTTLGVAWSANGNAAGTTYLVVLDTLPTLGSAYLNAEGRLDSSKLSYGADPAVPAGYPDSGKLSVWMATAPAAGAVHATMGSYFDHQLYANTTYYLHVQAIGGAFVATGTIPVGLPSAFADFASTSTLANPPVTASIGSTVSASGMDVTWLSGATTAYNPLNRTRYQVVLSTQNSLAGYLANTGDATNISLSTTPVGPRPEATIPWGTAYKPGAAYFAYARAYNHSGLATSFAPVSQGNAPPAAPSTAAVSFPAVASTGTVTVAWADAVNAAGQSYGVVLSTVVTTLGSSVADPATITAPAWSSVIASTTPSGALQATVGGLRANTTFYLYVQTRGQAGAPDSPFIALAATSTLAGLPTTRTFTGLLDYTFYDLGWASGTVAGGYNPPSSTYTIILSTINVAGSDVAASAIAAAGNSVTQSSAPGSVPFSRVGLAPTMLPNAIYFAYVNAVNHNAIPTAYVNVGSTSSLALPPMTAASTFSAVAETSFLVAWSSAGNPPNSTSIYATTYTVTVSTVGSIVFGGLSAASAVTTTSTQPAGASVSGLLSATRYVAYVSAKNHNGLATAFTKIGSTVTLAIAPAAAASPFGVAGSSYASVSLNWTASNSAGTAYRVLFSTIPSVALGAGKSSSDVTASTAPSAAGPAYVYGLAPTTTYYAFAAGVNETGLVSTYTALGSTRTLAAAPTLAASSVGASSATANWGAARNAAGTVYVVFLSVDPFFGSMVASILTTNTSATFAGLSGGVNYYLRVSARAYDGTFSNLTVLPAVTTSGGLNSPVAAAIPCTAVGTSKLTANWQPVSGATAYRVLLSTAGDFSTLSGSSLTANVSAVFGLGGEGQNLDANKRYYAIVQATGTSASPFTSLGSTVTLSNPPNSTDATVWATSASVTWLSGNTTFTKATIDRSSATTEDFTTIQISTTGVFGGQTGTQKLFALDLLGCSTYWFRVKNANADGISTAYDTAKKIVTGAPVPRIAGGFTARPSTASNQAQLSWFRSPTEGVTRYNLYADPGSGVVPAAGTTPLAVYYATGTTIDSATGRFTDLAPVKVSSPSYTYRLNAVHRCGGEETNGAFAFAPSISTTALAAARATIVSPPSGARIVGGNGGSNSFTLTAAPVSGRPSFVAFQYKASAGAGDYIFIGSGTAVPFATYWDATPLAFADYLVRAVAYDSSGSSDTYAPSITVTVIPALTQAQVIAQLPENYVSETVSETGLVTRTSVLQTGTTNTFAVQTGGFVVDFEVPPDVFGSSVTSVALEVVPNPPASSLPASPSGLSMVPANFRGVYNRRAQATITPSGLATQIKVLGDAPSVLAAAATIKLSYGTLPSGMKPSDIKIYVSHAGEAFHLEDGLTTLSADTDNNKLIATTTRLSFFAGFGTAAVAANLGSVRVYPVPWKPHGNNPDEGGAGVIFDQLPAAVTIRIYTLSGREVAKFDTQSSGGSILWDGRNTDGRDVASGGYIAVIKSGSEKAVKRLVIVR